MVQLADFYTSFMNPKTLVLEPEPEAYSRTVTQVRRVSYNRENQVVNDAPLFQACLTQQECRKAVSGAALLDHILNQPVRTTFFYQMGMVLRQIHLRLTETPPDAYQQFATEFIQLLWCHSVTLNQHGIDADGIYSLVNKTIFPVSFFSPVRLLGGISGQTFFVEGDRLTGFRDEGVVRFGSPLQDCTGLISVFHAQDDDLAAFNKGYVGTSTMKREHIALWGVYMLLKQQKNRKQLSEDVFSQMRQYLDEV